jgi:hypothetical protein
MTLYENPLDSSTNSYKVIDGHGEANKGIFATLIAKASKEKEQNNKQE